MDIMRTLGVGLIAAGVDKTLKVAGKKSGLLRPLSRNRRLACLQQTDVLGLYEPQIACGRSGKLGL